MTIGAIGPLPQPPDQYDVDQVHQLLARAIGTGWQVSNVTADTVLNADSTTTAELADVLGTLITQMKDRGILGG